MKQSKQETTKVITGEGGRVRHKKRWIVAGVVIVVLGALGGGLAWYHARHTTAAATQQHAVQNTLSGQESDVQQEQDSNAPAEVKTVTYANLAESYAIAKQCSQAGDAITKAQQIAPPDWRDSVQDSLNTVNKYCH